METIIAHSTALPQDQFQRPLRDLRISLTDRCNFRCVYCMPSEVFGRDYKFLPRHELLSFEEIQRVVSVLTDLGVQKIRLTGGEPLLRRNSHELILMLREFSGLDLAMTTNGARLKKHAAALARCGLNRVTVSLDSLRDEVFQGINDVGVSVAKVLEGIEAAAEVGLGPVKINMVVKRGLNESEILPMARHFMGSGHVLRFIEFMDVGSSNGWNLKQVVPAAEILKVLQQEFDLEAQDARYRGEVARRWRNKNGAGEIGIVSSVSHPFCTDCTRLRLSAEGKLYTCLFATKGLDFRAMLRDGASDSELKAAVSQLWSMRGDRYSELRSEATGGRERIEMSYIGG